MHAMSEVRSTAYYPLVLTHEELEIMSKAKDIIAKHIGRTVQKVRISGSGVSAGCGDEFVFELTGELK